MVGHEKKKEKKERTQTTQEGPVRGIRNLQPTSSKMPGIKKI